MYTFTEAPDEVKEKILKFYRDDILHNEDFKASKDYNQIGARVNALIGLKYFNALNAEEEKLFNKALEMGIIRNPRKGAFLSSGRPLP